MPKAPTRIYAVISAGGLTVALIRATNRAQALNHYARKSYVAELPSQDDLIAAVNNGLEVEDAVEVEVDDAA